MLLALVLRWPGLGTTNLWLDEANSWLLAKYPLPELLANIRASPGSPLYFLLLKLWVQVFGDSERALRALSLVTSLALVPATYALGTHTLSRRAALIGTLLLALSPLHLYYAQEARVYMQLALVATACLTAYAIWRSAALASAFDLESAAPGSSSPGRRRARTALAAYVVCAVMAVYTLNLAVLLLLAINLDLAIECLRATRARRNLDARTETGGLGTSSQLRRPLPAWLVAQLIVVAACLPLLLTVDVHTAISTQAWRRALGVPDSLRGLFDFFASTIHGGYIYPWDLYHAIVDDWGDRQAVWVRIFAYPLTLLAVLTALSYPPRSARAGSARVLYLALLLPLLAGTVVSATRELSLPRYFLFTTPCLYLLIGAGISRMVPWLRVAVLAVLVATMGIGVHTYRSVSARDSDYRPVARWLAAALGPGDAIVIQPPEMGVPLSYYLRARADGGGAPPIVGLAAGAPLAGALVPDPSVRTWVVLDYRSGAFRAPPDQLARATGGHVASDSVVTPGTSGVRVIAVDSVRPRN